MRARRATISSRCAMGTARCALIRERVLLHDKKTSGPARSQARSPSPTPSPVLRYIVLIASTPPSVPSTSLWRRARAPGAPA
jgi:hypothetical protein